MENPLNNQLSEVCPSVRNRVKHFSNGQQFGQHFGQENDPHRQRLSVLQHLVSVSKFREEKIMASRDFEQHYAN